METFLEGIALSATGGLGWLSYTLPRLTIKLLLALFILFVFIQICFKIYKSGWDANEVITEKTISNSFSFVDSLINENFNKRSHERVDVYKMLIKENGKARASINRMLIVSSDEMKSINDKCDYLFYIAYGIIVALGILSYIFSNTIRKR